MSTASSEVMAAVAQRTAEQLFLLDTKGWCVVEDALTDSQVQQLLDELQIATQLDTSVGKEGELMTNQVPVLSHFSRFSPFFSHSVHLFARARRTARSGAGHSHTTSARRSQP